MRDAPVAPQSPCRVSAYWQGQFAKNRADASLWTNNHIVARHINRLITDSEHHHWLLWLLNCYLPQDLVFENSLSICCGDAAHELVLASSGRVKFINGIDISEGALQQARDAFAAAAINPAAYRFDLADANELPTKHPADLILSTGALHHVTKLETLLSRLVKLLTRDGYFVVLEYVGPNHFQWRKEQLDIVNSVIKQLDPRYLRDSVQWYLSPPKLHEFRAIDPSEAVRSADIMPLLRKHFMIEYLREFNGTIMHPLYPLLNPALTNAGTPDFDSILRLILLLEASLIKAKVLSSDFVFAICRAKRAKPTRTSGQIRRMHTAVIGHIDVFDETGVHGWALNVRSPDTPIDVDVYVNGELQATVRANLFREDLREAGHGDGNHAFAAMGVVAPAHGSVARVNVSGTNHILAIRVFGQS